MDKCVIGINCTSHRLGSVGILTFVFRTGIPPLHWERKAYSCTFQVYISGHSTSLVLSFRIWIQGCKPGTCREACILVMGLILVISSLCNSLSCSPLPIAGPSFNFYWSLVDLQCCISFRCTAKWISYTYTYIHSFLDSFPIQVITEYWEEFPVLYSRSLLVIYFIYSSVCICQSQSPNLSLFPFSSQWP